MWRALWWEWGGSVQVGERVCMRIDVCIFVYVCACVSVCVCVRV